MTLLLISATGGGACFAETRDDLLSRCLDVEVGRDQGQADESCARAIREGAADAHWIANELTESARPSNEKGQDAAWASAIHQRALRYEPDDATLYFWASITAGTQSKYDEAIDLLTKAIDLNPLYADAYSSRGGLYEFRMHDRARALADYTAAISVSREPIHLINRGNAYYASGDYQRAFADYDAAAAREPQNAYYRQWACKDRAEAGLELDRATQECETVLRVSHQEWPTALYALGLISLRRNAPEAAATYFQRAFAANDLPLYQYARGVALRRMGRRAEGDAEVAAATEAWADAPEWFASTGIAPE